MKHTVKSDLFCIETLPSMSAVQTWTERVRVAATEPVFFTCWLNPKNAEYAQLSFYGGQLANVTSNSAEPINPGGTIASGIVEGFVQAGNFIAARILDYDGNVMYPLDEACNALREAGFATLNYRVSQRRGPVEILDFCLMYDANSLTAVSAYEFDGVTITLTDSALANTLSAEKNNPPALVTYKFAVPVEAVEQPNNETTASSISFGFYGKLPRPHKEYKEEAETAGFSVSETPTYLVVFDTENPPDKFRGRENAPTYILPEEFTKLIENGTKEEI